MVLFGKEGFFRDVKNVINVVGVLLVVGCVLVVAILAYNSDSATLSAGHETVGQVARWVIDTWGGRITGGIGFAGILFRVGRGRVKAHRRERERRDAIRLKNALSAHPGLESDEDRT